MKKPFFKTAFGKILVGAGDAFTGGTISNIVEKTESHEKGKMDIPKAIGVIATAIASWIIAKYS